MRRLASRRSAHRRASSTLRLALLAAPLALLAGCTDSPQDSLKPAGEWARKVDGLWDVSFLIAVVIFLIVEGLLVFALIRFRNRPGNESPRQIHGSTPLEIGWTILPALILAGLAIPTVATIWDLADEPKNAVQVIVTGHQWWWEYDYPDLEVETANELHIPADTQINVTLRSYDVIHSFWAPQLAGKVDVVPGHTNRLAMHADEPGLYLGQCAEFCGLSHANMRLRVIAHAPAEFDEWVASQKRPAEQPPAGDAAAGYALWASKGCQSCHTIDGHDKSGPIDASGVSGKSTQGPNLTHLQSRSTFAGAIFDLTPENLRKWLRNPSKLKPMDPENNIGMPSAFPPGESGKPLSDEEIEQLVAYLETLK
ncbi:MAG: cytochrome c oxidase subunit II [Actinobacteria bacterium]|nr:cytochrome c oxidase subunit II [Actinomycetota bacterium]